MKVGIFYSYGHQFVDAVNYIYEQYPNDEILLFLPKGYPTEYFKNFEKIKIHFLSWDGTHLNFIKALREIPPILKVLRKNRLDLLVILFDSPRLIILSKLSKASRVYIFNIFSEYKPLEKKFLPTLIISIWKIIKGYLIYYLIYCHTLIFPVKKET